MISNRPYLLRALHQWIVDSGCTPQILVDATFPGVDVPPSVVTDGQVVLNVSYSATQGLELSNEWIMFAARFSGVSHQLAIPMDAVRVIFVRENDWQMVFPAEPPADEAEVDGAASSDSGSQSNGGVEHPVDDDDNSDDPPPRPPRGHLKVIK